MMNLPVRNLGQLGIVTDINPHDLPVNAFNDGLNIVFNENRVLRAPVQKTLYNQTAQVAQEDSPLTVFNYNDPNNGAIYGLAYDDNTVTEYVNGVASVVTPTGAITSGSDPTPYTHCEIAGLTVLCREVTEPYIRDPITSSQYELMSVGDWPSADRAAAMRPFKDFIIALNVTASGVDYDTMVKWTDVIQYRALPASGVVWTPSASNNAGSNILTEFRTPIVDGLALGNIFVIYSTTESAIMEYTGSQFVFSFRSLFDRDGVINKNCVASTGREHYVFGDTDIYKHDGVNMQSIANNRVRERIYTELNRNKQNKCFVYLDEVHDLVYFGYVSDESNIGFPTTEYCNKAAVYNLKTDTWSFVDLPNVAGAAVTNISTTNTSYAAQTSTYTQLNVGYSSFADASPRITAFAGMRDDTNGLTEGRVYANDMLFTGLMNSAAEPETLKTAFVERRGLDLDETKAPLRSYKNIVSMIPQIITVSGLDPVVVSVGSTDFPYDDTPNYVTNYTFTPAVDHKVDSKAAGRLIAYRVEETNGAYFNLSAADFELEITSER